MQLELFSDVSPGNTLTEHLMRRGSGVIGGKQRIHAYTLTDPTTAELADFLKDEYGIGGFGRPAQPNTVHQAMHDSKGIRYEGTDEIGREVVGKLTWREAAEMILGMVKTGSYLEVEEVEQ